ncbi:hypothetical protein ACHAW5_002912 [Stephanodiscus triporus]|uniref:Uncharacterized protein n=1 Tax=Stephanodiscus triporus TaxID=2934178 RepID=A0ABD3PVT6_9STRA
MTPHTRAERGGVRGDDNARRSNKWTNARMCLAALIAALPLSNYLLARESKSMMAGGDGGDAGPGGRRRADDDLLHRPPPSRKVGGPPSSAASSSPLLVKANSIDSYWWPSAEHGGGLLGRIHASQNPADCSSPDTKFFVWRSMKDNENDTRGLTAWAHAGTLHLFHALTDGDGYPEHGVSRVLLTDDKLWPMARGCEHGPETRECYFEPLSHSCGLGDVDDVADATRSIELKEPKDEYDRSLRTVYSSEKLWFRVTQDRFSWMRMGGEKDHSATSIVAATFAYYFRPRQWLIDEIDRRIRLSMPPDLNPERTVGVPIRRSDKCHGHNITGSAKGELQCPPLSLYLDGVRKFLEFDPHIENVIVTSEDKSACDEFLELLREEMPSLRAVLNVGDAQQGTGSGSKLESYVEGVHNADVVASALTSMHLQLRARYFVITSKSTWTATIAVMARAYGFASEILVIDIGSNHNTFSEMARSGCTGRVKG